MSTEIPEQDRQKSIYQLRREAIARAVEAWQQEDGGWGAPFADADALMDCLSDEGLLILPRTVAHGRWMVLVDNQPACYPGQDRQAGPVDAEQAAEMFLIEVANAEAADRSREITVRPATSDELVRHAWNHITGGGR